MVSRSVENHAIIPAANLSVTGSLTPISSHFIIGAPSRAICCRLTGKQPDQSVNTSFLITEELNSNQGFQFSKDIIKLMY